MAYVPIGCIQYDRTFFLKERKAGLYSTAAWYCAYMSVETFIITNCSLSCGILYAQLMGFVRCWSVAVRPFGLQILCQLKFAVYFGAICNGLSLLFSQILMLSVAITRNLNAAFIIAMGVFIQGFITSGFPVDLTSMNPDATWLQYTSVFHYPYDACQRMLLGDDYAADQGFVWPKRSAIAFDLVVMYGAWLFLHIPTFYAFVFWQDRSDEKYDPHTRAR
ncbi:ATPase [Aureococcus anophagefferens]|nr:ATPase [Aureococcus anophagefferens]